MFLLCDLENEVEKLADSKLDEIIFRLCSKIKHIKCQKHSELLPKIIVTKRARRKLNRQYKMGYNENGYELNFDEMENILKRINKIDIEFSEIYQLYLKQDCLCNK